MSDSHEGMHELIDAFEKNGGFFGEIGQRKAKRKRDSNSACQFKGIKL